MTEALLMVSGFFFGLACIFFILAFAFRRAEHGRYETNKSKRRHWHYKNTVSFVPQYGSDLRSTWPTGRCSEVRAFELESSGY